MSVTNSIDALNTNKNNFDFFEIDFNFTKDQKLVCIHDWEGSFEYTFGFATLEAPSYDEFIQLVDKNPKFKNCTLESLIAWLKENPNKRIVTDVKDQNLGALRKISREYPEFINRFIPQIYAPDEYYPVHQMGYRDIIFTLYRFGGSHDVVAGSTTRYDFFSITLPLSRVDGLAKRLNKKKTPTYVHTINSQDILNELQKSGITEIYTDQLSPSS